jgi:bifunctional non-homologous end joining protein LigD
MEKNRIEAGGREVEVSRLEKILFPKEGISKGDLVDYYRRIADRMLPHVAGRAMTLQRFPDGIEGEGFFQKSASDYFPDWIRRARLPKENGDVDYVVADDAATLVYLANQAMITPHISLSRVDDANRPDKLVFDLDPSIKDLNALRDAARGVGRALEVEGLTPFLMTTGSKGFHIVAPLDAKSDFGEVRAFCRKIAEALVRQFPDALTVEQRKNKRAGRIFLDYLRNAYGQTSVAPYGVRARAGAPVATPLDWSELGRAEPDGFTIRNLFRRLAQKADPWERFWKAAAPLPRS